MITDDQVKAIEALAEKYPGHYMAKFFTYPRLWDREAEKLADHLDVNCERLDVLDIGCGFGYFVNVCFDRGCNAWGLDVFDKAIGEAAEILRVKVVFDGIEADRRLPGIAGGLFDIITMFGCSLRHGHPATSKDYWGWDEYRFFFTDIATRLRPGGRFVIRPNVMTGEWAGAANLHDHGKLRGVLADEWERVAIMGPEITLTKGE
jgi:SAM-dependent methyltransferase